MSGESRYLPEYLATIAPTRRQLLTLGAVAVGGALGSLTRYEIARAAPVDAGSFPWTTFLINVSGSLALGVLMTFVVEHWPPTRFVRPFFGVGVCGGYTTWSTFMTETAVLLRDDYTVLALTYLGASLLGGLAAVYLGMWMARWLCR